MEEAEEILEKAWKFRMLYRTSNNGKEPGYFLVGPMIMNTLWNHWNARRLEASPSLYMSAETRTLFGARLIQTNSLGANFLDVFDITYGEPELSNQAS